MSFNMVISCQFILYILQFIYLMLSNFSKFSIDTIVFGVHHSLNRACGGALCGCVPEVQNSKVLVFTIMFSLS